MIYIQILVRKTPRQGKPVFHTIPRPNPPKPVFEGADATNQFARTDREIPADPCPRNSPLRPPARHVYQWGHSNAA
eukprot:6704895-Alexandrium_andersonii.AAC.1